MLKPELKNLLNQTLMINYEILMLKHHLCIILCITRHTNRVSDRACSERGLTRPNKPSVMSSVDSSYKFRTSLGLCHRVACRVIPQVL